MKPQNKIDKWLFTLFALPLFVATLSTAAANIFGVLFLITYVFSGYWHEWRQLLSRTWFWPLMALVAINFMGMLWTEDTVRGLQLLVKLKWVLYTLAGATLPWRREHFVLLVRLFLVGIAINAVIGGLQWFNLYPWRVIEVGGGRIGYTNRIFFSMTLTCALLWIAYDLKNKYVFSRLINSTLAAIFFVHLIFAGGRAGLLSFVLLMPMALWLLYPGRWRVWAMIVVAVGVIGMGLSPQVQKRMYEVVTDIRQYQAGNAETSIGFRLVFWEGALLMTREHPFLGVGTGDYTIEMDRLHQRRAIPDTPENPVTTHPHNSFLAYLANLGLIGLAIFVWFLWAAIKEAWKHKEHATAWYKLSYMGIFVVGSLTDTLIWGVHNSIALGLIVAIPCLLKSESEEVG